jgi:hypothetical protein
MGTCINCINPDFIVGGDLDVAMTMVVGFEEDMVTGQGMKWTNGVL